MLTTSDENGQLLHPTDACMPHLSAPYGRTKVAMVEILYSMECIRLHRGKAQMNLKAWEDLYSDIKVTPMEWGVCRIKSASHTCYIRLSPIQALQHVETRQSGSAFYYWSKKATKFMREELRNILLSDKTQDVIFGQLFELFWIVGEC
jgi:hypothetical protein